MRVLFHIQGRGVISPCKWIPRIRPRCRESSTRGRTWPWRGVPAPSSFMKKHFMDWLNSSFLPSAILTPFFFAIELQHKPPGTNHQARSAPGILKAKGVSATAILHLHYFGFRLFLLLRALLKPPQKCDFFFFRQGKSGTLVKYKYSYLLSDIQLIFDCLIHPGFSSMICLLMHSQKTLSGCLKFYP